MGKLLSTQEVAVLTGVTPSTVKRWADQRLLVSERTAGGHRRFRRESLDQLLNREQVIVADGIDPALQAWVECLVGGQRHLIDDRLLTARAEAASWYEVADQLALVLRQIGQAWACGAISISEEHAATDTLMRALSRIGDALPVRLSSDRCLLACAEADEHTLGLSLAELCLRELGKTVWWMGRQSPLAEIVNLVESGRVQLVAMSASSCSRDVQKLADLADALASLCAKHRIGLVLGGAGAWPQEINYGVRLSSFSEFHRYVAKAEWRR